MEPCDKAAVPNYPNNFSPLIPKLGISFNRNFLGSSLFETPFIQTSETNRKLLSQINTRNISPMF